MFDRMALTSGIATSLYQDSLDVLVRNSKVQCLTDPIIHAEFASISTFYHNLLDDLRCRLVF